MRLLQHGKRRSALSETNCEFQLNILMYLYRDLEADHSLLSLIVTFSEQLDRLERKIENVITR